MSTRRRLDHLTQRIVAKSAAAESMTGGQCHTDPAHVAQVLQCLYDVGAVDVLEGILDRAGLTLADITEDELSPVGNLPPRARR